MNNEELRSTAKKALIFGIINDVIGCAIPVAGLIFAILAIKNGKIAKDGEGSTKAMGIVGFVLGIVTLVAHITIMVAYVVLLVEVVFLGAVAGGDLLEAIKEILEGSEYIRLLPALL